MSTKTLTTAGLAALLLLGGCAAGTTQPTPAPARSASSSAPAPEAPAAPEPPANTANDNAVEAAKDYLNFQPFSQKSLAEQLVFDGYTKAQAAYGAAHTGANWGEQAVLAAKGYVEMQPFSLSALTDQLVFDGFTRAQAAHAAKAAIG